MCNENAQGLVELALVCMLEASGNNHNKDTIYDSCERKCKYCIIIKALKNSRINGLTGALTCSQCVMTYLCMLRNI